MVRLLLRLILLWVIVIPTIGWPLYAAGEVAVDTVEERFQLSEKVGWYRLDDGSERWLTWSTDGGLMLYDLNDAQGTHLRPVTEQIFTAHAREGVSFEVQFERNGAGQVTGFRWTDVRGSDRTAHRLADPPYHQREVTFRNDALDLVGLLLVPTRPAANASVIVVSGGIKSARDDPWYLYQADFLARNGIAVFLPDTRGTGKSEGAWETASFNDLAGDAVAAAQLLGTEESIDAARIGIVGIGDGAWVAPVAAAGSNSIRYLVTVSGSTLTPREQMRHDLSSDVRRYGTPDFLVPLIAFALEFTSKRRGEEWWERNGRFDPLPYWSRLSKPVLAVYGDPEESEDFPVRRSFERLQEARSASNNSDFTIRVIDDADHRLQDPDSGRIHPEYLDLLASWIAAHAA